MTFLYQLSEYTPYICYLSNITNAQQAVATTTVNHNFTVGENVSFRVSQENGMFEINNMKALVLAATDNTITVNINTLTFTPFINAGPNLQYPACVVPSSSGVIPGTTTINIEDAFDHINLVGISQ